MIALCKCGLDMTEHDYVDLDEPVRDVVGCVFEASGTRHQCAERVHIQGYGVFLCPRPRYHEDHGVPCGPLLGRKLW